MNLTDHFTLDELTVSQEAARSGLSNKPNAEQVERLRALCESVLEPLRLRVKRPVIVTSGFRSPSINRRIGGAPRSQHTRGEAADIIVPGLNPAEVVEIIRAMRLPFDQVIEEFGWVHVSHSRANGNRGEVLAASREGGRTQYRRIA